MRSAACVFAAASGLFLEDWAHAHLDFVVVLGIPCEALDDRVIADPDRDIASLKYGGRPAYLRGTADNLREERYT